MKIEQPHSSLPLEPGQRFGAYEIRRMLGRGTVAEVYRAFSPDLHLEVALKILHPATRASGAAAEDQQRWRFGREMQLISSLHHPNIARIFDYGDIQGKYYVAMELIEGPSLRDMLSERRTAFPPDRALQIFRPLADAVAYAHSYGVLHQDIRPGNILFDDTTNRPVLVDFGLVRVLGYDDLTTAPFSPHSPAYMSPEQAAGREVTPRSDIYSLGILLYELITGDVPFKGETATRVLVRHMQEAPRPPGELVVNLDPRIESAILRALDKDPHNRFATPREMLEALEKPIAESEYDTLRLPRENVQEFRQKVRLARRPEAVEQPEAPAGLAGLDRRALLLLGLGAAFLLVVLVALLSSQGA